MRTGSSTGLHIDSVATIDPLYQIKIGEKLIAILKSFYKTKHVFSNSYSWFGKECIQLELGWYVHENKISAVRFLLDNFSISPLIKDERDNLFTIQLHQISGGVISAVNKYFKEKLHDDQRNGTKRAELVLEKIESDKPNDNTTNYKNGSINIGISLPSGKKEESKLQKLAGEDTIAKKHNDSASASMKKIKVENNTIVESKNGKEEKMESTEEKNDVKESVDAASATDSNSKQETKGEAVLSSASMPRALDRFRSMMNFFFKKQAEFEFKFEKSRFKDIFSLFSFGNFAPECIQELVCVDESAAIVFEKLAKWQINDFDGSNFVTRDGTKVRIDASVFVKTPNISRSTAGSFCILPSLNADVNEVRERLHKVNYISTFDLREGINCFAVRYPTPEKTKKIFYLITTSMGWKAEMKEDFIVIINGDDYSVPEMKVEESVGHKKPAITPKPEKVKKTEDKLNKKKETPKANHPKEDATAKAPVVEKTDEILAPVVGKAEEQAIANEPKTLSMKDLFEKDEVLAKFYEIYASDYHWGKISEINKQKITIVLRFDLKNGNPETFISYLLNIESEARPLFSNEERIREFREMFVGPSFTELKVETQNKLKVVLKNHIVDSDPDIFIMSVIDLFE